MYCQDENSKQSSINFLTYPMRAQNLSIIQHFFQPKIKGERIVIHCKDDQDRNVTFEIECEYQLKILSSFRMKTEIEWRLQ